MEKMITIVTEKDMLAFGAKLSYLLKSGDVLFLQGDLGAGKTTLVRAILQGLGCYSLIRSPTYTLVESYFLDKIPIYHFDLYRINDPEELYDIGLTDYLTSDAIVLIEWPEKAFMLLPEPTLTCEISVCGEAKRQLVLKALNERGKYLLSMIE